MSSPSPRPTAPGMPIRTAGATCWTSSSPSPTTTAVTSSSVPTTCSTSGWATVGRAATPAVVRRTPPRCSASCSDWTRRSIPRSPPTTPSSATMHPTRGDEIWATGCATRGASRSTGRPAPCGSRTSGRTGRGDQPGPGRSRGAGAGVGTDGTGAVDGIDVGGRGANYGWDLFEGDQPFVDADPAPGTASQGPFIDPLFTDGRDQGCSVTGGVVYRGTAIPDLQGRYLYSDFCAEGVEGAQRYVTGAGRPGPGGHRGAQRHHRIRRGPQRRGVRPGSRAGGVPPVRPESDHGRHPPPGVSRSASTLTRTATQFPVGTRRLLGVGPGRHYGWRMRRILARLWVVCSAVDDCAVRAGARPLRGHRCTPHQQLGLPGDHGDGRGQGRPDPLGKAQMFNPVLGPFVGWVGSRSSVRARRGSSATWPPSWASTTSWRSSSLPKAPVTPWSSGSRGSTASPSRPAYPSCAPSSTGRRAAVASDR